MHASSFQKALLFIKVIFMEISKIMIWIQVYSMNRDEHSRF
jgi:hypothetical protein